MSEDLNDFVDNVDDSLCDFIDDEPLSIHEDSSEPKVIMIQSQAEPVPPKGFHIRITGNKEKLTKLIDEYLKKFQPIIYIFGYEEVDDNHHVHGHLEYSNEPSKQSISQWMKTRGYSGQYYHKKITTTDLKNKLYVVKELDLITHNLSKDELDRLIEKTEEINEDKKKDQRHKLLEAYDKYIKSLIDKSIETGCELKLGQSTLADLARWIMFYYLEEYDKEPPLAHIKGYTLYIAYKNKYVSFSSHLNHMFDNMF